MMIPKVTTVRLKGVPLKKLVEAVYKRDNHECIICGAWVEDGVKPHHEPQGSRKSDELDKMVLLCMRCHHERHSGKKSEEIRLQVEKYLQGTRDRP